MQWMHPFFFAPPATVSYQCSGTQSADHTTVNDWIDCA